ncbi:MAG: hypothetical protein QXJ81_02430 [Metallosphaera sp.]
MNREELEKVLVELESEGKIKKVGRGYEPINKQNNCEILLKEIRIIKEELLKILEDRERKLSSRDFDSAYERIRDTLGYAPLERIRIELGLSKEEFYSQFREHIEENYELIVGGEDGYVRRGVLYGIIKRKS